MKTIKLIQIAGKHPLLAALVSGILLILCWSPFSVFPLHLLCFIPLLLLAGNWEGKSSRTYFLLSSLAFAFWGAGTLYWITKASFVSAVAAILIIAFLSAGVFTLWLLLFARSEVNIPEISAEKTSSANFNPTKYWFRHRFTGYVFLVSTWISIEFLKENLMNYPWLNLGKSLASFPSFIQYYEFTGPYGGSLYLLVSNILIYESIRSQKKLFFLKIGTAAWILIPLIFSIYRFYSFSDYSSPVQVRIVQAGKSFFKPKGEIQPHLLDTMISRSGKHAALNTEYFIWPESAFEPWHALNEDSIAGLPGIEKIRSFLETFRHGNVIVGALTYIIPSLKKKDTLWYNSALCIESGGKIQIYHKQRLVPGSEGSIFNIPFSWKSSFVNASHNSKHQNSNDNNSSQNDASDLSSSDVNTNDSKCGEIKPDLFSNQSKQNQQELLLKAKNRHFLSAGEDQDIFYSHSGMGTAPVICFESVFDREVSLKVAKGAQFISLITNDAWWGRTSGSYQHLECARMLAIENRRWVVRSSLGGISAAFNPQGSITARLESEGTEVMPAAINAAEELTFYTMHGDILPEACLIAFLISGIFGLCLAFTYNRHTETH